MPSSRARRGAGRRTSSLSLTTGTKPRGLPLATGGRTGRAHSRRVLSVEVAGSLGVVRSLERLVAVDRGAVHGASLGQVVGNGVMLGVAVVPEGDIAGGPAPAQDELGLPGVREQELEQRLAFARLDAVDVRRESLVDE